MTVESGGLAERVARLEERVQNIKRIYEQGVTRQELTEAASNTRIGVVSHRLNSVEWHIAGSAQRHEETTKWRADAIVRLEKVETSQQKMDRLLDHARYAAAGICVLLVLVERLSPDAAKSFIKGLAP